MSDIQFSHSLSKNDLRAITRDKLTLKNFTKSVTNIHKRLEKHILINENNSQKSIGDSEFVHQLDQLIWSTIHYRTQNEIKTFDNLIKECYKIRNKTSPYCSDSNYIKCY